MTTARLPAEREVGRDWSGNREPPPDAVGRLIECFARANNRNVLAVARCIEHSVGYERALAPPKLILACSGFPSVGAPICTFSSTGTNVVLG